MLARSGALLSQRCPIEGSAAWAAGDAPVGPPDSEVAPDRPVRQEARVTRGRARAAGCRLQAAGCRPRPREEARPPATRPLHAHPTLCEAPRARPRPGASSARQSGAPRTAPGPRRVVPPMPQRARAAAPALCL
ncbi:unnamed protein product [Prorocentrum cordatum]|uniref:Uncharacterized protein n=1 Tax=Prorocentrum cordatum TaxID=2364126 RepID=A0ABN9SJQ8_9DINO|nr:unnamed protein product [Polarella glacialis]